MVVITATIRMVSYALEYANSPIGFVDKHITIFCILNCPFSDKFFIRKR